MTEPVERWLETPSGFRLNIIDLRPTASARLVVVLGHAMMVDRRTVYRTDRPSLAGALVEAGIRVLVPDLRGHGQSGPLAAQGGSWSYQDLVDDVGRYVQLAKQLEPDCPVALVGNSLFGHLSLAHVGRYPEVEVDALVGFAVNIWNERYNVGRRRWWSKRALIEVSRPVVERLGYLPARAIRYGSNDEPLAYWQDTVRWVRGNCWDAPDGWDYAAALSRVKRPFLHVISEGDTLLCRPDDARLFAEGLGNHRQELLLGGAQGPPELGGLCPGHIEMVSAPQCAPLWNRVAAWLASVTPG